MGVYIVNSELVESDGNKTRASVREWADDGETLGLAMSPRSRASCLGLAETVRRECRHGHQA